MVYYFLDKILQKLALVFHSDKSSLHTSISFKFLSYIYCPKNEIRNVAKGKAAKVRIAYKIKERLNLLE